MSYFRNAHPAQFILFGGLVGGGTKLTEPRDRKLFELTSAVVKDGVAFVQRQVNEGHKPRPYDEWPTIAWFEDGMPDFSFGLSEGPPDYKDVFNPLWYRLRDLLGDRKDFRKEEGFGFDTRKSFQELKKYIRSQPSLVSRMFLPDISESFFDTYLRVFVEYAVDRYIHVVGTMSFEDDRFLDTYLPLEAGLLLDELPIQILVPILQVVFPSDHYALGDGVSIVRMSEPTHLARVYLHHGKREVSEYILQQASHALVLTDWVLPNPTQRQRFRALEATAFPLQIIDAFFASVRIVTPIATGYAQILVDPIGWAHDYTAGLPPLEGITVRRYPPTLLPVSPLIEGEFSYISESQVQDVREIFAAISSLQNTTDGSRLNLVVQRLNSSYMREEEEDAILDVTIGLEILLSDRETQEITHKLALRLAALSSTVPGYEHQGATICRNVKSTIYAYRSAVVHGDPRKAKKKREVRTETGDAIAAVKLAVEYLGMAVRAVTKHPEYLDPAVIDEQLLLGRSGRSPSA